MSEEPKQRAFCQVCHGPSPDGHHFWCPIKTGLPVAGTPINQPMPQPGSPWIQQGLQGVQGGLMGQGQVQPPPYYIIEQLCDHLRELRREHPAKFFDSPHERLLRNLEAALESFYRAKQP